MELRLRDSLPPITEAHLNRFESEVEKTLPGDYRSFLLKHNGGFTEFDDAFVGFRYSSESGCRNIDPRKVDYSSSTVLKELSGIKFGASVGYENGVTILNIMAVMMGMDCPEGFLPIGGTWTGDTIVMCLSQPDYGYIFIWPNSECFYEGDDPTNCAPAYFVAPDFTAFLEGLFPAK